MLVRFITRMYCVSSVMVLQASFVQILARVTTKIYNMRICAYAIACDYVICCLIMYMYVCLISSFATHKESYKPISIADSLF